VLALALTSAACGTSSPSETLSVSVIGGTPRLSGGDAPSAVLRRATAQGLVRLDEAGVVTPGLASRWIVLDDGRTVIFRLAGARWADGRPMVAADVRSQLLRQLSSPHDDPAVAALASSIDQVNAVTPAILEVRLKGERPDLLALLAQPAFALTQYGGSGPWQAQSTARGWRTLARHDDQMSAGDGDTASAKVRLRGDPASVALARFTAGDVDVVLGGGWSDWPLARTAASGSLLVDPADGLFGLRVARRTGLLETAEGRSALAGALNGADLATRLDLGDEWARSSLVPLIGSTADDPLARTAQAQAFVTRWRAEHDGVPTVTIAPPTGPGGRLLFAWLQRQWARIGVVVERAPDGSAQLTVLDRVAPSSDPASTLELIGCGAGTPCDDASVSALAELSRQSTLTGWRTARAAAYRALASDLPVLPLGRPLRWSAVRAGVPGAVANPRAIHPLTRLAPASSRAP